MVVFKKFEKLPLLIYRFHKAIMLEYCGWSLLFAFWQKSFYEIILKDENTIIFAACSADVYKFGNVLSWSRTGRIVCLLQPIRKEFSSHPCFPITMVTKIKLYATSIFKCIWLLKIILSSIACTLLCQY